MENKQTAVEWLYFELKKTNITIALIINQNIDLFERAKAMEREQIVEAYGKGSIDSELFPIGLNKYISGSDYFTKTYSAPKEGSL